MSEKKNFKLFTINTNIDFTIRSQKIKTVLMFLIILLVAVFFTFQIIGMYRMPEQLDTTTAKYQTVQNAINVPAFVIRDESYVQNTYSGTVVPVVDNGSKVGNGDTVAKVYGTDTEAKAAIRMAEIEEDLAYYRSINVSSAGNMAGDTRIYNTKVNQSLIGLANAAGRNELSAIREHTQDMRINLAKRNIAYGGTVDVSEKINSLTEEYKSLDSIIGDCQTVKSSVSGYFVNSFDGYENKADYENVTEFGMDDVNELLEIKPSAVSDTVAGRLITKYNWYLVCNVPVEQTYTLEKGYALTVSFPNSSVPPQRMIIAAKNENEDDKTVTLVLRSNIMTAEIAQLRKCTARICVSEYTGFAIDPRAIRMDDDTPGVFVQYANRIVFKKVHIIYNSADVMLVAGANEAKGEYPDSYISVNDEVINKSKGLVIPRPEETTADENATEDTENGEAEYG